MDWASLGIDVLFEVGTLNDLSPEQQALLGPLGPDDIAERWFDGAELVVYHLDNGDIIVAPRNYELRAGDPVTAQGWTSVTFATDTDSELHLAGGLKRFDGLPEGFDDPNYDASPNYPN